MSLSSPPPRRNDLTEERLYEYLGRLASFDRIGLTREETRTLFGDEASNEVYDVFERKDVGRADAFEILVALAFLSSRVDGKRRRKFIFDAFDFDRDGLVRPEERVLRRQCLEAVARGIGRVVAVVVDDGDEEAHESEEVGLARKADRLRREVDDLRDRRDRLAEALASLRRM